MLQRLWELARLFAKLGCISFGGPAAHVALMEDEVVRRRQWLTREHFLDLLGATNLIPGPNALEMAAHVGYQRAGMTGLLVAGVAFTLPAALITAALAWAYVGYGHLPEVEPFLRGIQPAVLAIVFAAVCRLAKTAIRGWPAAVIGAAVAGAALAGLNEIGVLLVGGVLGTAFLRWTQPSDGLPSKPAAGVLVGWSLAATSKPAAAAPILTAAAGAVCAAAAIVPLWQIGLYFLEIGAVLYGSGYVLVAYLQGGLVDELGWLSQQELFDAVAAGQLTPGPLVTTATFVGYLLGNRSGPAQAALGAATATAAIILPGLVLVAIVNPWIPRLRRWPWAARFLDAVSAASIGLMASVTVALAHTTLAVRPIDWRNWAIALASAVVLLVWRVPAAWIVLGGALVGRVLF